LKYDKHKICTSLTWAVEVMQRTYRNYGHNYSLHERDLFILHTF
jgi:hypothetical protein